MQLLDIALVRSLATWVWGEDDVQVSPEVCIGSLPLMHGPCWSSLVVKGLGIGIIVGACLSKLPVILNILNSKSGTGLSRTAVYGEAMVYANCFSYGYLEHHPITAYGENGALLFQSLVIVALIWWFSERGVVSLSEQFAAVTAAAVYVGVVTRILSPDQHYLLMASVVPIFVIARGTQILATYQIKHTGAQSIVTTTMNLVGTLVRVLTTVKEVGWDLTLLSGYIVSSLLNACMFGQYWLYRANTEQYIKQLSDKKQK